MTSRVTKIIKKNARHELATKILRGELSDPRVKEILQTAPSNVARDGYSGKPGTSGFDINLGTTNKESGGPNGRSTPYKRLIVNTFNSELASRGERKGKRVQVYEQKMTRSWADNLAGAWLNAHQNDDTPYSN